MALKENEIKMEARVSNDKVFTCINVRNDENEVIGVLKNGAKVTVTDFSPELERNIVTGKDKGTKKQIKGTIPTNLLHKIS